MRTLLKTLLFGLVMVCGGAIWYGGWMLMRVPATSWELPTLAHLMVLVGAATIASPIALSGRR